MVEPFQNKPQICLKVLASEVLNVKSRSYQIVKKDQLCLLSRAPSWSTALHLFITLILLISFIITSSSITYSSITSSSSSSFFASTFSLPSRLGSWAHLLLEVSRSYCNCIFQHFVTNYFDYLIIIHLSCNHSTYCSIVLYQQQVGWGTWLRHVPQSCFAFTLLHR